MAKFKKLTAYKYVSNVGNLIHKALAHPNKTYKDGSYKAVYDTEFNGNLILEHYGTKILTANPQTKEYTLGGGYSLSDANAISTAFTVLGISAEISRKNGEFEAIEASKKVKSADEQHELALSTVQEALDKAKAKLIAELQNSELYMGPKDIADIIEQIYKEVSAGSDLDTVVFMADYTTGYNLDSHQKDAIKEYVKSVQKVLNSSEKIEKNVKASKKLKSSTTPTSPKPTNPAAEGYTWAWSSDLDAWVQAPKDNPGVVSMVGNTTGDQSMQIQASEELKENNSEDVPPYLVINYAKELYLDSHLTLQEVAEEVQEKWPELDTQRAITLATKGYNAGKEGKVVSAGFMKDIETEKEEQALALIDSFIKNQISIDELQLKLNSLGLPEEVKNKFLSDAVNQNEDVASLVALEDLGTQTKTASQIKCFTPRLVEEGLIIQAGYDFKSGMKYKVSDKGVEYMLKVAKKLASQMK